MICQCFVSVYMCVRVSVRLSLCVCEIDAARDLFYRIAYSVRKKGKTRRVNVTMFSLPYLQSYVNNIVPRSLASHLTVASYAHPYIMIHLLCSMHLMDDSKCDFISYIGPLFVQHTLHTFWVIYHCETHGKISNHKISLTFICTFCFA